MRTSTQRLTETNGVRLRVTEAGERGTPLAQAGFHVLAPDQRGAVPSLFIGGTADPTLAYTPRHRADEVVSGPYREVMIDGAGHCSMAERRADVNELLVDFLRGLELS